MALTKCLHPVEILFPLDKHGVGDGSDVAVSDRIAGLAELDAEHRHVSLNSKVWRDQLEGSISDLRAHLQFEARGPMRATVVHLDESATESALYPFQNLQVGVHDIQPENVMDARLVSAMGLTTDPYASLSIKKPRKVSAFGFSRDQKFDLHSGRLLNTLTDLRPYGYAKMGCP